MKPRIVYLLVFTALMAFLVAAPGINLLRLVAVVVAGTLASGGAGALNCYLDRDVDREMGRTSWRPIPQGEVSPVRALLFGLGLIGISAVISAFFLPLLAGLFIVLGAAIYVLFYTKYLKRRTSLNIVLGRLGRGDRATRSASALVDGPLGLRLDSQPFLGARYESRR